jgi:hypothetical protein
VRDPVLKNEYSKACDAALRDGFDLEQIHEKQDADFFIQPEVTGRFDPRPWLSRAIPAFAQLSLGRGLHVVLIRYGDAEYLGSLMRWDTVPGSGEVLG